MTSPRHFFVFGQFKTLIRQDPVFLLFTIPRSPPLGKDNRAGGGFLFTARQKGPLPPPATFIRKEIPAGVQVFSYAAVHPPGRREKIPEDPLHSFAVHQRERGASRRLKRALFLARDNVSRHPKPRPPPIRRDQGRNFRGHILFPRPGKK